MFNNSSGSNNEGSITCSHKRGAHKHNDVSLVANCEGLYNVVLSNGVYLGSESAWGMCAVLIGGDSNFYFLSIEGLNIGDVFSVSSQDLGEEWNWGDSGKLNYFSKGALVCLVETACGHRPVICSAPGSYGVIQGVFNNNVVVSIDGSLLSLSRDCFATLGVVQSKPKSILTKAGDSSHSGVSPTVSGEAMNAVDHPHGRSTSGGKHPSTAWGKLAKFVKNN